MFVLTAEVDYWKTRHLRGSPENRLAIIIRMSGHVEKVFLATSTFITKACHFR